MSVVYLLGAGFSRAISGSMPLLKQLGRETDRRYLKRRLLSREMRVELRNGLEQVLTRLTTHKPWLSEADNLRERAVYLDLANVIRGVLVEATKRAALELHTDIPKWLETVLIKWHKTNALIITLNYDTLVEQIVSSFHLPGISKPIEIDTGDLYPVMLTPAHRKAGDIFFGGDHTHKSFNLYKLHGSINWYYSGAADFFGETIYYTKCFGGLAGMWREKPIAMELAEIAAVVDKVPLVVPPATDKAGFLHHETFRSLWFGAARAIATADRVVCLGYSLPASDVGMVEFLKDAGRERKQRGEFEIVDLRPHRPRHFKTVLGATRFNFTQRFSGTDALEAWSRTM